MACERFRRILIPSLSLRMSWCRKMPTARALSKLNDLESQRINEDRLPNHGRRLRRSLRPVQGKRGALVPPSFPDALTVVRRHHAFVTVGVFDCGTESIGLGARLPRGLLLCILPLRTAPL